MENREALENKTALENAGFKPTGDLGFYSIKGVDFSVVGVHPETFEIQVYEEDFHSTPLFKRKGKNLKDARRILYGILGYKLDFSPKKYDWETVWDKLSEKQQTQITHVVDELENLKHYNPELMSEDEAQSVIAKLKLNIIIRQIDKDYPPTPTETAMGGIKYQDGELQVHYFQDGYSSGNSKIVVATLEGAKILLDQNPQLLQNLFKIETDATGED